MNAMENPMQESNASQQIRRSLRGDASTERNNCLLMPAIIGKTDPELLENYRPKHG